MIDNQKIENNDDFKNRFKREVHKWKLHFGFFKGEPITYEEVDTYHNNFDAVMEQLVTKLQFEKTEEESNN